jgi:hypothetical protein
MEARMNRHFVTICLLGVFPISLYAQVNTRRDGIWWNQRSQDAKLDYVRGFVDGMVLGNRFSVWGKKPQEDAKCRAKAFDSFQEYNNRFFANVSDAQLADALDVLYKDSRNHHIMVEDAMWLVVNSIAGMPQDELNKLIESWRNPSGGFE